tara:strand:- start:619 stop:810 length:192 start_codon:yes stop_codon:yes gene_type:complete
MIKYSLLKKWFKESKTLLTDDIETQIDNYWSNINFINIEQDIIALQENIWIDILNRELKKRNA